MLCFGAWYITLINYLINNNNNKKRLWKSIRIIKTIIELKNIYIYFLFTYQRWIWHCNIKLHIIK